MKLPIGFTAFPGEIFRAPRRRDTDHGHVLPGVLGHIRNGDPAPAGSVGEEDLLLLADAQTSGGLLVAGELPGAPVIGELIPRRDHVLVIK